MPGFISRPTRREREERLAESRDKAASAGIRNVEGVVRRTEEAYEIERARAREGMEFKRPFAVSGDSPEAKQAEQDLLRKAGIDPESYRPTNG